MGPRAGRAAGLCLALLALGLPVGPAPPATGHDHGSHDHGGPNQGGHDHSGHEGSEGLTLAAARTETVAQRGKGTVCPQGAKVRAFDVVAVAVDLTLNRYLDHDPNGRMYVLEEDVPRLRSEEAGNAQARAGRGEPAVSLGLANDAIQPLTLRVNQGECLRVRLRNDLPGDEPASFHLHESDLVVAGSDEPAVAANPKAMARPGGTVAYEWMVEREEPEGTHYFHSHGNPREQAGHGLFGAVIVERAGSAHLDPVSGRELRTGWAAVIRDRDGSDFREFALYYHEVGDESYLFLDRAGTPLPLVDPLTGAYRPSARALNYRSEPFFNRLRVQQAKAVLGGRFDESVAYSSYAFGDPATPVLRTYLGDPIKQRVIHGGSEVAHVHHTHGGSIRWRRQPGVEPTRFDSGLDKHPPLRPQASERIDSQAILPSETFDVENECGSGGCQQSVGDFLYHCHVAHHYFSGMWGLWRVYNTAQDGGPASTDSLGPLSELPDRQGRLAPAVTSAELPADLQPMVERQLPPRGVARGYDASVFDWSREGDTYLDEPETAETWPGYRPSAPGTRPPLRFDPRTGKLAYPFLRPHLGKRPPFPPDHSPAPFLDPFHSGLDPPAPGENGPASVCPAGTRLKSFALQAVTLPITLNRRANLVDPAGELYVLKGVEEAARSPGEEGDRLRVPLAIRANAGQDCVDVLLRSELADSPENHGFAKVNLHIHFVQFDIQASDGVIAGFNYEASVRPFAVEGERFRAPAAAGATELVLERAERFQPGVVVGVGMDQDASFETARVREVRGATLVLDAPLRHAHGAGEYVSVEFARSRWYPDVQFGTAYFHDHVNAVSSWRHGLFGALVAEPPGSTYHDPYTGAEIEHGPVADIHSTEPISVDVTGSFREVVLFVQDDNPLTQFGRSAGGSFNLKVEPLEPRRRGPPSRLLSSDGHGDPETPVVEALLGDPVMIRALVAGTNEVHTLHVDGHWFRLESWSRRSPPVAAAHVGIAERADLVIPAAGGPRRQPGDYLYANGRSFKFREGSWGLLRVRPPGEEGGPRPLPGRRPPADVPPLCPRDAPARRVELDAVVADLPALGGRGKIYVPRGRKPARPEPLVLHAAVGNCLVVDLANETDGPVSFHADLLAYAPGSSGGVAAGRSPDRSVAPGARGTFTFYADPEVGEGVALVRDFGDPLANSGRGLYGAVVIGPKGAAQLASGWAVDVDPPGDAPYRDVTLFVQDEDAGIGSHRMPYSKRVAGPVALNYAAEPLEERLMANPDRGSLFLRAVHGDPATPVVEAEAGTSLRLHVLAPWSEQAQVFALEGHRWSAEPGRRGADQLSSVVLGGLEAITISPQGGAGGPARRPGDYLYGDHRGPYQEAGLWGIVRVLPERRRTLAGRLWPALLLGVAVAGALVVVVRRRGLRS
jgi:FtsP/CotA-like multicopper oxidase with cupredoxin domain